MYRGTDHAGKAQGGPMYFIVEGLGKMETTRAGILLFRDVSVAFPEFNPIN